MVLYTFLISSSMQVKKATQEYIINETNKIYELQGVTIARKHIELIVKQMMSRVKITALETVTSP
jgi:hypothetical protein